MSKGRIPAVQLNVAIPLDLADDLDVFCERLNISKKALVELALRRTLLDEGAYQDDTTHKSE